MRQASKVFLLLIACLSVRQGAAQMEGKTVQVQVVWEQYISDSSMIADLATVTDRSVLQQRLSLVNQALGSPNITDAQRSEYKYYKKRLLQAELKVIEFLLNDPAQVLTNPTDEFLRTEQLKKDQQGILTELDSYLNYSSEN